MDLRKRSGKEFGKDVDAKTSTLSYSMNLIIEN